MKQYRAQGLRGALGVYTLIAAPLKTARAFLCFGQTAWSLARVTVGVYNYARASKT